MAHGPRGAHHREERGTNRRLQHRASLDVGRNRRAVPVVHVHHPAAQVVPEQVPVPQPLQSRNLARHRCTEARRGDETARGVIPVAVRVDVVRGEFRGPRVDAARTRRTRGHPANAGVADRGVLQIGVHAHPSGETRPVGIVTAVRTPRCTGAHEVAVPVVVLPHRLSHASLEHLVGGRTGLQPRQVQGHEPADPEAQRSVGVDVRVIEIEHHEVEEPVRVEQVVALDLTVLLGLAPPGGYTAIGLRKPGGPHVVVVRVTDRPHHPGGADLLAPRLQDERGRSHHLKVERDQPVVARLVVPSIQGQVLARAIVPVLRGQVPGRIVHPDFGRVVHLVGHRGRGHVAPDGRLARVSPAPQVDGTAELDVAGYRRGLRR